MRKHKGFTLVELIVAFAVLGIATLAIGGFFVTSSRSYSGAKNETALQYEAQLSLNQIESMIIDSTLGVNYNLVSNETDSENGFHFVKSDSEYAGNVVSKVLYIFSVDSNDGSKMKVSLLKWSKADKCLYYKEFGAAQADVTNVSEINIAGTDGWDLFAEEIEKFSIDLSKYEKTKKVDIGLHLKKMSKDYQTKGTITLRNNVLINEALIQKIYENINRIVESEITGVSLKSNPEVAIPGGAVQMIPTVLGTGYPSQEIYQWLVAVDSNMEDVIFDSLSDPYENTYINVDTQVLYVDKDLDLDEGTFHEVLYVRAVVDTGKKLGDGTKIFKYNETAYPVKIKRVTGLDVTPTADLSKEVNSELTQDEWDTASLGQAIIPEMDLYPGNVINMNAVIQGSESLTADEKTVVWTLIDSTGNPTASITAAGVLEIGRYSEEGSFLVRAALKLDRTNMYVDYRVNVGNQFDGAQLEVTPDIYAVNRGGRVNCSVMLNGKEIPATDCNWSVSVAIANSTSQGVIGTPVIASEEGILFVSNDLSYDYKYIVTVKASLKTNPNIYDTESINVPKLALQLTPAVLFSSIGSTIVKDQVICTVIGLEEYDIDWSMARGTYPDSYFTASGRSYITGYTTDKGKTAEIVIGVNEQSSLNYMRIKATLAGYANYFATMRVNFQKLDFLINVDDGEVKRGETENLNVALQGNIEGMVLRDTDVTWSIVGAVRKSSYGQSVVDTTGLTIDAQGVLSVPEDYQSNINENIVVTIQADWNGVIRTETVTILKEKVQKGDFFVYPGEYIYSAPKNEPVKKTIEVRYYSTKEEWFNYKRIDLELPEGATIKWKLLDANGKDVQSRYIEIVGYGLNRYNDGAVKIKVYDDAIGKNYILRAYVSSMEEWYDDITIEVKMDW